MHTIRVKGSFSLASSSEYFLSTSQRWRFFSFSFNPLSANPTKWSDTLKQFVGKLPTNCLSVFDHFVGLALKGLSVQLPFKNLSAKLHFCCDVFSLLELYLNYHLKTSVLILSMALHFLYGIIAQVSLNLSLVLSV